MRDITFLAIMGLYVYGLVKAAEIIGQHLEWAISGLF